MLEELLKEMIEQEKVNIQRAYSEIDDHLERLKFLNEQLMQLDTSKRKNRKRRGRKYICDGQEYDMDPGLLEKLILVEAEKRNIII